MSTWALVLAAGEGSRLRALTTTNGVAVPKQFCSPQSGPSLLQEALRRAEAVAPRSRICTIVAEQHRRWWEGPLWSLPPQNIIVQPENRGTAAGLLLPLLLHIEARDPQARVVVLPVPTCGWSDLGTPKRVAEALRRLERNERPYSSLDPTAHLSLAAQHARLQMAM